MPVATSERVLIVRALGKLLLLRYALTPLRKVKLTANHDWLTVVRYFLVVAVEWGWAENRLFTDKPLNFDALILPEFL